MVSDACLLRERHFLQVREEVGLDDGRCREDATRSIDYDSCDFVRICYTRNLVSPFKWFQGISAVIMQFFLKRLDDYEPKIGKTSTFCTKSDHTNLGDS